MLIKDKYSLDKASARKVDSNGYMHVETSNLTKEQVVPYMGNTIPGYKELGLQPDKVYMIYRPAEEIKKAADTFNGLPLMLDHWEMDAENIPKDKVVGSLGTKAEFKPPYLTNALIITDADAIRAVEDGSFAELSAAYTCDIDMTAGIFDGVAYDGIQRNIKGNHVALVPEGRAGHDVKVADSAMEGGEKMTLTEKLKEFLFENLINKGALKEMEEKANLNTLPVEEQAKDTEPVDQLADNIREMMQAAGLNPEDETAQKAFIAGMAASEKADDEAEEKTADECGEPAKDEEAAKDEEPAKACDSKMVQDRAFYAALYKAAEDVAPFIGKINNPFAFDSAAAIYKKALDAKGVVTDGVDPSAYGAMVAMLQKPAAIPTGVEENQINKMLQDIKSR